jgi:hypothetical protein
MAKGRGLRGLETESASQLSKGAFGYQKFKTAFIMDFERRVKVQRCVYFVRIGYGKSLKIGGMRLSISIEKKRDSKS